MNHRKKQNSFDFIFSFFEKYPREYYVFGFFFLFFLAIVVKTFSYTVFEHSFYKSLADNQQIGQVEIPVTRGGVYAQNFAPEQEGGESVFSSSVYLSDIAIDPQMEGNKERLGDFLTDILYQEMCDFEPRESCYNALLRFLRVLEIPNFSYREDDIKDRIAQRIRERISQTKVTSVLLQRSLTLEQESEINSWSIPGVYPGESGLYVNPEELANPEYFAEKYAEFSGKSTEDILYSIRQRDLRYIPIYRKLSLVISDQIQQYLEEEQIAIGQGVLKEEESIGNFIILEAQAQRIYPEKNIGAGIIGFLDNEGKGHYGIEGYFDDMLRGNPGALVRRKDIRGRSIEFNSFQNNNKDAVEGVDIYTTIDRNIQRKVENILGEGVKKYRANRGSAVVMDPKTGKILALANYPSYDPNNPGEVYELKQVNYTEFPNPETDLLGREVFVEDIQAGEKFIYDGKPIYLREALREEYADYSKTKYIYRNSFGAGVYQNDTISSLYEPGSIMKAITVAIGIETGEIRPYDFYLDEGQLTIDNFTIRNVDNNCLGYQTFQNALNFSCNIGMIRIVQKIGKALTHKYLHDFGFGQLSGLTLEGEVFSKIDPYEKWPTSRLLTTSYGLGVSVTPVQMAAAYSVLANGGVYMKPYIVESIIQNDGSVIEYKPEPLRRVIKSSTSDTMIDMLVDGVENGVAKNGAVEGYTVAGKTGTSQIAYGGGYEQGAASTQGSFAGFAPAEDPKFVVVVKLERPRTSQYGGSTSAFIFADIAEELLRYYRIPQKNTQ